METFRGWAAVISTARFREIEWLMLAIWSDQGGLGYRVAYHILLFSAAETMFVQLPPSLQS
jgi:hypothetical protein